MSKPKSLGALKTTPSCKRTSILSIPIPALFSSRFFSTNRHLLSAAVLEALSGSDAAVALAAAADCWICF